MFSRACLLLCAVTLASGKVTTFFQSDFNAGSVVISSPGTYQLGENISFGEGWTVEPDSSALSPLGFFAAIVVAADDVELDLNGFTLQQSEAHYLSQRFFSLIELGSKPFIQGQGPADFGEFLPAKKTLIHNGVLGLSSHHAIHGNDVFGTTIENLRILDFEVAGIALNGVKKVTITNCDIGPSSTQVPVNGLFAQGTFLRNTLSLAISEAQDRGIGTEVMIDGSLRDAGLILGTLDTALAQAGQWADFANPNGLPDGSALYGILIFREGAAVGDIGDGEGANSRTDVHIDNVDVHDLALSAQPWGMIGGGLGPFGDQLDFSQVVDADTGKYVGFDRSNVVFLAQIALATLDDRLARTSSFAGSFGATLGISPEVRQWVADASDVLVEQPWFEPVCNVDLMAHILKGVIGLRLEFADQVTVRATSVYNLNALPPASPRAGWTACGANDAGQHSVAVSATEIKNKLVLEDMLLGSAEGLKMLAPYAAHMFIDLVGTWKLDCESLSEAGACGASLEADLASCPQQATLISCV
jgi:hypothetical protein